MSNLLKKICEDKIEYISSCKQQISEADLLAQLENSSAVRGFFNAINEKVNKNENALIAEIKKASPSKGLIREDFDPQSLAKEYEKGGATCISVLTDQPYFQGKAEYLTQARETISLPVLRKDFILDPYQVIESRVIGADCILLIMSALEDNQAAELEEAAVSLDMDVLIEIHDKEELERALNLKSNLIGINNRNLKTLDVDLAVSENLSKFVPEGKMVVCESGIYGNNDILRLNNVDVYAFLVGESLMKQDDVELATRKLLQRNS